jgi:flagellar FliL protein
MITVFRTSLYFLCLFCSLASFVHAEEDESALKVQYHELKPSFVANFGETTAKRLKFIKADITVRAYSDEAISVVQTHDALVRHQVVMILSAQSEASLAGPDGQERLRKAVVAKVKAVLKEETGKEQIDDLLFTSFVVQQ